MKSKNARLWVCLWTVGLIGVSANRAAATNVGTGATMSAIQVAVNGDGIINFDQTATLTMNADGINVATITVADGVTGTIAFGDSANRKIVFKDAAGAITLGTGGTGTLTITGTDAGAGFDFATTAAGKTLTITSSSGDSLGDAVAANRIILGRNNVLTYAAGGGAANAANEVVIANNTGGVPTLDINNAVTIATLTVTTSGDDVDIDIASGVTLTVTNAATLAGDSILELIAVTAGGAETLAFSGGLTLNGTSVLRFTNDSGSVTGTVTAGADGVTIDANGTATVATLTPTNNINLDIAAGKTLTITNAVTVPTTKIVTFTGTTDAFAETLTLTGGMTLTGPGGELNVTGDNTTAMVVGGMVTAGTADGAVLDVDASASITVVNMTAASGDLTLQVATGKTLTTTIDVNNNTLTLSETGTVSTVQLDTALATVQANANATITTLTHTAAGIINLGDGVNLTVTNAFNVGANKLTLNGSGGVGQDTFTATVQLNDALSELEINGADLDNITGTTVTVSADGATLDTNFNTAPTAVNMTAAAGDLTLQVATGKTMTTTIDVNNNTLTLSETGTVSTVQMDTAAGVLNVDESCTLTAVNGTQSFTIDVASTKTLTTTATIAANTLTLTGTGAVSRIDATTGTITDNGGTTVSDLRATFGTIGTFTWGGSGSGTITTLANALPGAGETLNKVGTGALTIASGFTTAFANAAGVKLDIDAGTVVLGSPGTNDDVTFNDDADEITVASGATLTTYGSFSVGAAGANVNLDAAAGSTVNLSSNAGAETITGAADDDYNLLGTVNINGTNGDYTINDAFNYKFGSISINTTGSLINNQPSGELKFVPSSVVTVNGSAIFTVNGQSTATRIIMDTTTGTGAFTLDRTTSTSSANVTIHNVSLNRATYTGSGGASAGCELTLSSVEFGTGLTNWVGCSYGSGGGSTPGGGTTTPTQPPLEGDTTNEDTGTTPDAPTDDGATDTTGPIEDGPATDQVADDGSAEVNTDSLSVGIDGLLSGTRVSLQTDDSGVSTLTIGEEQGPDLTVALAGFEPGANLDLFVAANGDQILTMSNSGGNEVLTLLVKSGTGHSGIRVTIDDDGNQDVVVNGDDGSSIVLDLNAVAQSATVGVGSDDQGNASFSVSHGTGENMDMFLTMSNTLMVVTFGVTYDEDPSANPSARIKTGFPGLQDEESLGGSVTLSASGLTDESIISIALTYEDSDLQGVEEADLRLHRFSADSNLYEPAGTSDVGVSALTEVLGDYGVDVASNSTWAEVTSLGKFAIGVPLSTRPTEDAIVTPLDGLGPAVCGTGGTCGAMGLITMPMSYLGLIGLRRSMRRCRRSTPGPRLRGH